MTAASDRLFLPWVRRGLAGALKAPPTGAMPARGDIGISVSMETGPNASNLSREAPIEVAGLTLMGPGDVAGLGPDTVKRSEPPDGTTDMFPNLMPSVEFTAPDLPWMFTPSAPLPQDRLLPWVALICVEDGQEGTLETTDNGIAVVNIAPKDGMPLVGWQGVLPDLTEAWAWAHVQVSGISAAQPLDPTQLQQRLEDGVGVISRLICPRNLRPETAYLCAVVPVFKAGVAAGLGQSSDETGFAWTSEDNGPIRLPAFHTWRFRTAVAGDFEALARLIQPRPLGPDVGRRAIDVQRPGLTTATSARVTRPPAAEIGGGNSDGHARGLPFPIVVTAETKTALIEGALRPVRSAATEPPADPLADGLAQAMMTPELQDDAPVIGPPAYGRWAAGRATRDMRGLRPDQSWLSDIATSTRYRAAAGIGAELVRQNQDSLMEQVWAQFGAVEQINDILSRAQLSRSAGRRLADKHLQINAEICTASPNAPQGRALDTVLPIADRIMGSAGRTAGAELKGTPEGQGGAALRRLLTRAPVSPDSANARRRYAERLNDLLSPKQDAPNDPPDVAAERADLEQAMRSFGATEAFEDVLLAKPDWPDIRTALCAGLDPDRTQVKRAKGRLGAGVASHQPTDDDLHPVLTTPDLPRPLYIDLKKMSQDWLLPGLDKVADNALCLLESNGAFIEAFMAGINHELCSEMLWRGFPTDRRGTPLRSFWDRRGAVGDPRDIYPMHLWSGPLGSNNTADTGGLVLLLRGELLRRFPETLIYAQAAETGDATKLSSGPPRLPVFRGTLAPDVTFLGFDLQRDDVLSKDNKGGHFFMIEGPPTEPRFGLDETLRFDSDDFGRDIKALGANTDYSWDPLYWGDLLSEDVNDRQTVFDTLTHVPVDIPDNPDDPRNATLANARHAKSQWGFNAAHMAAITLQLDTRLAVHADALINGAAE